MVLSLHKPQCMNANWQYCLYARVCILHCMLSILDVKEDRILFIYLFTLKCGQHPTEPWGESCRLDGFNNHIHLSSLYCINQAFTRNIHVNMPYACPELLLDKHISHVVTKPIIVYLRKPFKWFQHIKLLSLLLFEII